MGGRMPGTKNPRRRSATESRIVASAEAHDQWDDLAAAARGGGVAAQSSRFFRGGGGVSQKFASGGAASSRDHVRRRRSRRRRRREDGPSKRCTGRRGSRASPSAAGCRPRSRLRFRGAPLNVPIRIGIFSLDAKMLGHAAAGIRRTRPWRALRRSLSMAPCRSATSTRSESGAEVAIHAEQRVGDDQPATELLIPALTPTMRPRPPFRTADKSGLWRATSGSRRSGWRDFSHRPAPHRHGRRAP